MTPSAPKTSNSYDTLLAGWKMWQMKGHAVARRSILKKHNKSGFLLQRYCLRMSSFMPKWPQVAIFVLARLLLEYHPKLAKLGLASLNLRLEWEMWVNFRKKSFQTSTRHYAQYFTNRSLGGSVEVIKRSLKGYELREATSLSDTVYDVDGGLAELRTWSKAVLYIWTSGFSEGHKAKMIFEWNLLLCIVSHI